jgi:hypothetical protein
MTTMTNRWMRNMLYTTLSLTLLFALSFPAAAAVEQTDERGLIDIKELETVGEGSQDPGGACCCRQSTTASEQRPLKPRP